VYQERRSPYKVDEWRRIQETVQKSLASSAFGTWIRPLGFDKIDLETLFITAPTRFVADWVGRNFFSQILAAARQVHPDVKDVRISVGEQGIPAAVVVSVVAGKPLCADAPESPADNTKASGRYTFENFAEGASNALAAASLKRALSSGAADFNPLLIHSPSGFGKTHLLLSFAGEFAAKHPEKKLIYTSADRFMHSFVKAVQEKDTQRFKDGFKSADVLVVDDIHFIEGKEQTAKELFHVIEDYVTSGRQVVLASNASPFSMEGLNAELKSRISHGLVLDIAPADYALRLEIVRRKSEALGLKFADGVAEFVASKISASIRDIEGALNRLSAHAILMDEAPSLSNVRKTLSDILAYNSKQINVAEIKRAVAEKWGVPVADMDSERRQKQVVVPRQVAMYVAKSLTSKSLPEIGRLFGGRNHATVIHAVRKVKEMLATDPRLEGVIQDIERIVSAG
jgi:chromosomal replication initiator protein